MIFKLSLSLKKKENLYLFVIKDELFLFIEAFNFAGAV